MDTAAVLIATMQHRRAALTQALGGAGWTLAVYDDVASALNHLRTKPFAAVFCDEYLRGASAGGFLAWCRRIAPDVPFYVVAVSDRRPNLVASLAPDRVLAFPPDAATLPRPTRLSTWDAPAVAALELPLEGRTDTLRLTDLIEMLALTSASAVIALGGGLVGRAYVREGQLEHVVTAHEGTETTGVRGLGRLLDLPDTDFQVLPYRAPSRRTVHVPTTSALGEAARLVDEQRRDASLLAAVADSVEAAAIAVGYAHGDQPTVARGAGAEAFERAVRSLDALKAVTGTASHLALELEDRSLAALRFGGNHVLAATAPRGRSLVLLAALVKAVKQHGR